jgi:Fe-S protein assembly co-chaperone HscB
VWLWDIVLGLNAFEVLGIAPALELDPRELERRYVALSRECHPDHGSAAADGGDRVALLERSAALNDAYKTLRERWSRAQALVLAHDPTLLEATKRLDPAFLARALERAERVENASGAESAALHDSISRELEEHFALLKKAVQAGDLRAAATRLHEARYLRKALSDLEERT